MTLAEFNALPEERLLECCGSRAWAAAMVRRRPYLNSDMVQSAGLEIWQKLSPQDWREAFGKHPKIGEKRNLTKWSTEEQKGVAAAADYVTEKLAALNQSYFEKFGFIFIVCASGKTAAEMLSLLERRLPNAPEAEIAIAAAEHAKITALRLHKLLAS